MTNPISVHAVSRPAPPRDPLREAAQEMETQFLAQMLRDSGLGKTGDTSEGGIGEEQFSSLLVEHQARAMVQAGGIGLAEAIYQSLVERR